MDLQIVTLSDDFLDHPYIGIFQDLNKLYGTKVNELRMVCLRHQIEVLNEMLTDPSENYVQTKKMLDQVRSLHEELQRSESE